MKVKICLFGPMALVDSNGASLLPKSAKTCGLLALLATAPNLSRPRRWLEEKLWSDRGPEQAAASLRQSLSQLRRVFIGHPGFLMVDRKMVQLDRTCLESDIGRAHQLIWEGQEFLEGLSIRDPRFVEWLTETRAFYRRSDTTAGMGPSIQHERKLGVLAVASGEGSKTAEFLAEISALHLSQSICEQSNAQCFFAGNSPSSEYIDIEVHCDVVERNRAQTLLIRVSLAKSGLILHTKTVELGEGSLEYSSNDRLLRALFDSAEHVLRRLPHYLNQVHSGQYAAALVQQAICGVFSFDQAKISLADRQLQMAFDQAPNAAILAWRAFIRNIQFIEQSGDNPALLKREAEQFIAQALVMDGDNSFVMSMAAIVRVMLFQDALGAMDLARPAVEINPNSVFALQSISMAHMHAGNTESAYLLSKRCQRIAGASKFGYWWDLLYCLACISSNRFAEAIPFAESAARRAPNFCPPLRALVALYGHAGNPAKAAAAAARLASVETDFSIQRFFTDKTYPIKSIRTAGLLQMPKISVTALRV